MNEVPLIQDVRKNDINTSIIAIKKQLKQLIEAVGLIESPNAPDLSPYVKKADVTDVVEVGNSNPVTSNGVAIAIEESIAENIVDVVEDDNLKAVTSNAVAESLSYSTTEQKTGGVWVDGKPIYRRVFFNISYTVNQQYIIDLSNFNISKVINILGCSYDNGGYTFSVNSTNGGSYLNQTYVFNNKLYFYSTMNSGTADITLEYTKTTD